MQGQSPLPIAGEGEDHDDATVISSGSGFVRCTRARNDEYGTAYFRKVIPMPSAIIRPARTDEYNAIAGVWMNSWTSTGLEDASDVLLAKLRAKGWSLFVADDRGQLAAMLALHLPQFYLDQLFVAPEYQGQNLGRRLLAFSRQQLPDEIWLRCVRENEKAWRWYEREGFVFEKEAVEPMTGLVMKYYRWKRTTP
jgi:ribosomal protein S18 acetylase RimI-like enzyme